MSLAKWVLFFLIVGRFVFAEPSERVIPDQLYFPTLMKVLDGAKKQIDILQFSFAIADDKGNFIKNSEPYKIAQKLIGMKQSNPDLQIRLYIEGERDTATRNKVTADYLREHGIEVKEGQTHAKGFAVDGETLLLGSTNLTTQSMRYNNETNLLLAGHPQIVAGFSDYFGKLWNGEAHEPSVVPSTPENGMQLLTDGKYKEALLEMIRTAKKTIDFSIYYFNDPDIEKALIEAKNRVDENGKKLDIKIRGYVNHHKSFGLELVERNRKTVERLKKAGLTDIFFDRDTFFSHSKYLIADGERFLLGTGNWNRTDVEEHPQLYLRVENKPMADKLSRHLSHQIAYESDRPVPAQLYYRFWVGSKKPELPVEKFDEVIRDRFVRATIKTGEAGGLHGYLPVLLAKPKDATGSTTPDEIALVVYQDEPTYRALREGAVGSVYGPLHFDYFDRSSSKSAVPELYKGEVKVNGAYDLSNAKVNWQKGHPLFSFSPKDSNGTVSADSVKLYLDRINAEKNKLGISGYTVLVGDGYLIEYFNRSTPWTQKALDRVNQIKSETLKGSYGTPSHVEAAHSTGHEGNGLQRPTTYPFTSLTGAKGSGTVNVEFEQAIKGKPFLDGSQASFERTPEEETKLAEAIKDAFVNNKPIPHRDTAVEGGAHLDREPLGALLEARTKKHAMAQPPHAPIEPSSSRLTKSERTDRACEKTWKEWRTSFTSSSPIGARKKLQLHAPGKPEFEMLFSKRYIHEGNLVVVLKEPIQEFNSKGELKPVNAFKIDPNITAEYYAKQLAQFGAPIDRNELVVASMAQMIRDNPRENLLIITVGHHHALEFFFNKEDIGLDVMYGAQRIDERTSRYSDGFREFVNSIEPRYRGVFLRGTDSYFPGGLPAKLDRELMKYNLADFFEREFQLAWRANEDLPGVWSPAKIVGTDSNSKSNVLVVGENHFVPDMAPVSSLPSAACLREQGFSSVTFVLESQPYRPGGYSLESLKADHTFRGYQNRLLFSLSGREYSYDQLLKDLLPESAKIRETKSIEPTTGALVLGTAERLSKEGLTVYFTGVEPYSQAPAAGRLKKLREWVAVDKKIQINRKGLATSGSTAFAQQLQSLWTEREAIEKDLKQYPVAPDVRSSDGEARPGKIRVPLD